MGAGPRGTSASMVSIRRIPPLSVSDVPTFRTSPTAAVAVGSSAAAATALPHRQAAMASSPGWTSPSAKGAGVSPPPVLTRAIPESGSLPSTRTRRC